MECKGCKKEISEADAKQVGVWHFCGDCFEDLLAGGKDKGKEAPEPVDADAPADTVAREEPAGQEEAPLILTGEQKTCTVCNAPMAEGEGYDMGILTVCAACYREMVARPEPVKIAVEEPEDPAEPEPDIPFPDPMETVSCHACRRTIKKVGAKIFEDNLFCPDCFYKNNYHQIEDASEE